MRLLSVAIVGQIIILSTVVAPDEFWRHPTPLRLILISQFGLGMILIAILMVLFDFAQRAGEARKQCRKEEET